MPADPPPAHHPSATVNTNAWYVFTDMSGNPGQNARFSEYRNTGPGAGVNGNRPQVGEIPLTARPMVGQPRHRATWATAGSRQRLPTASRLAAAAARTSPVVPARGAPLV
ncbi:hypothetical protein [Mangrovihabitans endophyticus]|uniref:Uncharacterized protein n=1 Tax=Mangrovihabitans endophyticus TaxID=1751298 RepID=A0A8J3FRK6_9ACTN|nr:hypothetical protein [Mangrovihabitans endophyticus]GGL10116.1 hypothetical protein GCM10012284_51080 [Mangrovihabitans endophyticus]